jgi:hypothetical protein
VEKKYLFNVKPIPKFFGTVKGGKVLLDNQDSYDSYLLTLEEKRIEMVVKKEETSKTIQQTRYLFGVVYELISEHTGYSKEEVHELMKSIFLKSYKTVNNKRYTVIRSIHDLNTVEMTEYIEQIKRWCATELQIFVPEAIKTNI